MQSHRSLVQVSDSLLDKTNSTNRDLSDISVSSSDTDQRASEAFRLSLSGHFITRATEALEGGHIMRAAIYVDAAYEAFRLQIERAQQRALKSASSAERHSSTQPGRTYGDAPQLKALRPQ